MRPLFLASGTALSPIFMMHFIIAGDAIMHEPSRIIYYAVVISLFTASFFIFALKLQISSNTPKPIRKNYIDRTPR